MKGETYLFGIYCKGCDAAAKGLTAQDNPYPPGSEEALRWASGFETRFEELEYARTHPQADEVRELEMKVRRLEEDRRMMLVIVIVVVVMVAPFRLPHWVLVGLLAIALLGWVVATALKGARTLKDVMRSLFYVAVFIALIVGFAIFGNAFNRAVFGSERSLPDNSCYTSTCATGNS
jgi:hypothetical protein